jgi:two-component sensor histidine kinase
VKRLLTRPIQKLGTRTVMAGAAAAVLALLVAMGALMLWQSYRQASSNAELRALSAAQVISAHVTWLVEANNQLLRRIDDALGDRPDFTVAAVWAHIDEAIAESTGRVAVLIFGPDGAMRLTNTPGLGVETAAGREFFIRIRAGEPFQIGRMEALGPNADKMFLMARRIERNGQFLGAAAIAVPAALMTEFWRTLDLGPDSAASIVRDDGWIVARHPIPPQSINIVNSPLFTEHLAKADAGFYANQRSPADQAARVVGFQRVPGTNLVAVAGISLEAAMADFWARATAALAIGLPVLAALIALSVWVMRLLRRDERTRDALAQAVEQNQILFREIHHRVKNNLKTVSALIQLQPGNAGAKAEMRRRIAAMASVHEHIYLSDQFASLALDAYIARLVSDLSASFGPGVGVTCNLSPAEIDADRALIVGLICNEAISNAIKHGFPDGRAGRITVMLECRDDGANALLRVADDGIGYGGETASPGMGSRLIDGLSRQIGGTYTFRNEGGTVFTLMFPLTGADRCEPDPPRSHEGTASGPRPGSAAGH